MVSGKYPTHPSLRLRLEARLGLGLSFGLWEGWVGGFWEMAHPLRVKVGAGLIFRFMEGVGRWFLGNIPPTPPLGYG